MRNKGMTIVFAVLLVSIVLTVSLILFNITFKQIVLSGIARDSRYALYAADSAINCALFWDSKDRGVDPDRAAFGYFSYDPDTGQYIFEPPSDSSSIECVDSVITVEYDGTSVFTVYYSSLGVGGPSLCAKVDVVKSVDPNFGGATTITARGYNVSDQETDVCPLITDRTVEAGTQFDYGYISPDDL